MTRRALCRFWKFMPYTVTHPKPSLVLVDTRQKYIHVCFSLDQIHRNRFDRKKGVVRVLRRPVIRPDVQLLRLAIVAEGGD